VPHPFQHTCTSRRPRGAAVLALLLLAACGDDEAAPTSATASGGAAATASLAPEGLATGDVEALLEALHTSHGRLRTQVGPHRMTVRSSFDVSPQGEPATPEPAVDELRPVAQHVDDTLELVWVTAAVNEPRFSLSQSNEHDRGRDVVVDGERIYTRQKNRGWYVGPLQADLYELWLDDAQRSVHDVVALAAPQLAISVAKTNGGLGADGAALAFTLSRATATNASLAIDTTRAAWRKAASIDTIEGTIVVDAATGAWLTADVRVGFSMPGPDGRTLQGRVTIAGELSAIDASTPLAVPTDAQPLLERTRYDAERARLLDGLAGR
jgi:hypothetical protein